MSLLPHVKKFANYCYGLAKDPGNMFLLTGTLGWILSSLGQVTAVIINKNIPSDQKKFLIPQELADAGVNIASFFILTRLFSKVGNKLVHSGKISTPAIREFLNKHVNLKTQIGKKDFDISKSPEFKESKIKDKYYEFTDGAVFIASTIGSIISCNIITPILRNKFAANRQKAAIEREKINKEPVLLPDSPVLPAQNKPDNDKRVKLASVNVPPRITLGGSMKI